ncbi:hypothetical protein [Neobacillus thermocopriae]|uniref:hypothetical protein n=1 Tax=Neobacillus thermocopriae TaxID=1215031 RepID=UPI002E1C926B|nr:hypothetical protein [Neobacillus thermocopriae]MED3712665.1 hypothetical protein [Neobacillus thermocopriae]
MDHHYKNLLMRLCKAESIFPRRLRFEQIEDFVIIQVKNKLKEGVDLECFKILNLIHQTVIPLGIRFDQQLYLYPGGHRLDKVVIMFNKEDYILLNNKLEKGEI